MKIVVTGASGLVGTNLSKLLEERGHEVARISRKTGFDLTDPDQINGCMKLYKPEVVYHLAANAAEARGQISPVDMTQRNINLFVNTLRASINSKVKKFIYTSSIAVYGEAPLPYIESGETDPKDVYGVNKLACEQILKIMSQVHGLDYTIFRPHNIYGPFQNMADPNRNVVALFMRRLIEHKPYFLYNEGRMRRAFSYVDDVVTVLADSLDKYSQVTMNIGSEKDVSIKELSDLLQNITGLTSEIEYKPARPQEIDFFLSDHTLQTHLVHYHETPLEEGLKKTWEWVIAQSLPEVIKTEDEIHV